MSKRRGDVQPAPEKLSYEQAVTELEAIIDRIEQGEVGLEESLTQFRRGEALLKRCRSILEVAEQQVREVERDSSPTGTAGIEDDEPDADITSDDPAPF